ncbi:EF-Hand 1, calcium-binding site,EF-hand domain pair,EF-hand domain [Cinara cedri]|uniref:EF-Hand 1, calcium-binding site,EF-hand domain pair,EF-hand domain n=1 Tax=Cinara cedri TaxID=506608 RepID=A0A5E4MN22_9HEMI|nr:EF-Hand 1, calcium-binding site,EF-hand domain pair,EF-hand domain [Cinara cedri]
MATDNDTKNRVATRKQRFKVLASFEPAQIHEFKIIFDIIDQNRDGLIDKKDLHGILVSLGKNPTDDFLEVMINDAPGPIDFTTFLMVFEEKLRGTDPGNVLKNAFGNFDKNNKGLVDAEQLRELLVTTGDKFTDKEVDEIYHDAPILDGFFDYVEFTRILKHDVIEKDQI